MTQPQIELLPCPNCLNAHIEYLDNQYGLRCSNCGLTLPVTDKTLIEKHYQNDVIAALHGQWAKLPRSSPQVAPGLRDALDAMIEARMAVAEYGYRTGRIGDFIAQEMGEEFVRRAIRYVDIVRADRKTAEIAAAQVQPDTELRDDDVHQCNCGGPMTRNPHPDAGKPSKICDVGTVFMCIPCTQKSLSGWCNRAVKAEQEVATLTDALNDFEKANKRLAAAQGGQVVDREKLRKYLDDEDTYHRLMADQFYRDGETTAHIASSANVEYIRTLTHKLKMGDFNSAVPSAPGCDRVKAALKEFGWPRSGYGQPWRNLYDAIEALGTPQGSDSLRWTTDIPTEAGYYWGVDGLRRLSLINVSHWYEDDDTLYYKAYMWGGEDGPLEEIGQPRLQPRMFAKYKMPSIPEPSQPVDAGEAQERGDNE